MFDVIALLVLAVIALTWWDRCRALQAENAVLRDHLRTEAERHLLTIKHTIALEGLVGGLLTDVKTFNGAISKEDEFMRQAELIINLGAKLTARVAHWECKAGVGVGEVADKTAPESAPEPTETIPPTQKSNPFRN